MGSLQQPTADPGHIGLYLHRETAHFANSQRKRALPVTILTGFLGAGKTTLLRRIIKSVRDFKIGAIVNDFASLNVDYEVVHRDAEVLRRSGNGTGSSSGTAHDVYELTGGCVCCSLASGLEQAIWRLLQSQPDSEEVRYLIVETSGVTDPLEMMRALDRTYGRLARVRLDSIVAVVDADAAHALLCGGAVRTSDESSAAALASQLACADVVLLNKVDLLAGDHDGGAARLNELRVAVTMSHAPGARVLTCTRADVTLTSVLDIEAVEPEREALGRIQRGAERAACVRYSIRGDRRSNASNVTVAAAGALRKEEAHRPHASVRSHHHLHEHQHADPGDGGGFCSCVVSLSSPVALYMLQDALALRPKRWPNIVRVKGTLCIAALEEHGPGRLELSGRARVHWSSHEDEWAESGGFHAAKTASGQARLVLIATRAESLRELEKLLHEAASSKATSTLPELVEKCTAIEAWISGDSRLELVERARGLSVVCFRLTGVRKYGFSEEDLKLQFGVDLCAVNGALIEEVNSANGALFLASKRVARTSPPPTTSDSMVCCALGVGHEMSVDAIVQQLSSIVDSVLRFHFRVVSKCPCGR